MRALFLSILVLSSVLSTAQGTGKITGQVKENADKKTELTGITLTLLRAKDSATVKITAAASDGSYAFEYIQPGDYLVMATKTGFKKAYSGVATPTADNPEAIVPALILEIQTKAMAGVTITAQKPQVEFKADRMIVNVEASISNTGNSALEVLEKSPGITVDKEGVITLKGKAGAQVYVDGRPVQMQGQELLNYLRSMNASQMDQVEIMSNPPARYDAEGTAGIINIKTKKTRTAGMNGSFNAAASQGRYGKYNGGYNFNYRVNKVNLYSTANFGYRKNYEILTIQRRIREENNGTIENYFEQRADEIEKGYSYNGKIGMDYFANKNTTLGFVFNGARSVNDDEKENVTNIFNNAKELRNITLAGVDNNSDWKNYSANVYFRRALDSTGREITSDLDYATYNSIYDQFMINSYFDENHTSIAKSDSLLGSLPQNISIYSGRIDYLHPLKGGAKFEAGIKSSIVETDNNAQYDSIQNGIMVHDIWRSNHFIYKENINAGYVNWSGNLSKKLQAQIGLRLENTQSKGRQITTGENFDRSYTQLFPTAYFQYKLTKDHNLGLNYGRRIRRPNYSSLNPFIRYIDRYTYSKGNPNLQPQFGHNIELTHNYKNVISTTINYGYNHNLIQTVIEQDGQETFSTQANIASMHQVGLSISTNNRITPWWTSNVFINIFYNRFEGLVNNHQMENSGARMAMSGSQQFKCGIKF